MEIKIEISKDSIQELKDMVPDFHKSFYAGMRKAMFFAENKVKRSFGTGDTPKVRTGHLRRSIQSGVNKKGKNIEGYVGSNVKYAAIHEFGGTIKPRTGEYLTFILDGQFKKVKQVVIPKRSYLKDTIENNIDGIKNIIENEIVTSLNR